MSYVNLVFLLSFTYLLVNIIMCKCTQSFAFIRRYHALKTLTALRKVKWHHSNRAICWAFVWNKSKYVCTEINLKNLYIFTSRVKWIGVHKGCLSRKACNKQTWCLTLISHSEIKKKLTSPSICLWCIVIFGLYISDSTAICMVNP